MTSTSTSTKSYSRVVQTWLQIPTDYKETELENTLMSVMWNALDLNPKQIRKGGIGNGLVPDYLIYQDPTKPPVLVVEDKKRDPSLASAPDQNFVSLCKNHKLYKDAVGHPVSKGNNGIKQYLDKDKVSHEFLASYGLVFNGDFFQLWRRVDGLVFPLTPIQRVTKKSLPLLMQQLDYCLKHPQPALVSAIWNQKGGVAKTTNTINFAATLALEGKRVLLIDFDLQGDLTRWLGIHASQADDYLSSCRDLLDLNDLETVEKVLSQSIQSKSFPTSDKRNYDLAILPIDAKCLKKFRDDTELDKPAVVLRKLVGVLKKKYDYIFFDLAPTFDRLAQCVLFSCDTVLIPVDHGEKSLHHGIQVHQVAVPTIREARAKSERLHLGPWNLGIVFSNCPSDPSDALQKLIEKNLSNRGFSGKQYKQTLKAYAQTKVAEFKHTPVICWQSSPITKLYTELVKEVFINHNFTDH